MNDPALRHTGLYCNQLSSTDLLKTDADGNQVSKKENPSAELADEITLDTWRTSHGIWLRAEPWKSDVGVLPGSFLPSHGTMGFKALS